MMLPKLKFDCNDHKPVHGTKTFSTNVCRSLLSYKAPVLKSLHLKICFSRCTTIDAGILIGIALSRNVRKLVLQCSLLVTVFKFPRCLLYNCETLETLKLKYSARIDVPSSVRLKSLTTLHLNYVDFKNDESVFNLLSGCPNLENLMVHLYSRRALKSLKNFKIVVPSLQRLSIFSISRRQQHWGYVINAPSLKYLKVEGIYGLDFCLIENTPKLVEANIIDVSDIINENLLESLTSVTRLSLALSSPLKIKFPIGSIFHQLIYLELYTNKEAWWNLLTLMLDSSPKLQFLKLIDPLGPRKDLVANGKWNQPKNVAECLLLHLETFVWNGDKEQLEEEIEVAKYILKNAICLKKATFSIKGFNADERLDMLEELESVVKVSNSSCKLVLFLIRESLLLLIFRDFFFDSKNTLLNFG
ncbi:putative F-box/FBD/LRR-repeat protein At4g13965 [Arabidopsis lyrata subsp. lyrata]|uniref:putative F-box/FBD/LRR-repeat protein At4g13965 n=1 Tax=Arabidopsis lyrata subsp. lyrata TaxID=81972 RepID=UPI000A29E43F|nr:putative F-box/FBD/LRR-repeat protein At4g13965 [Arabidopsis lyrata subsp. lyrata]|eukprot:XP_020881195.1 putative F-box/FBD/LRR-repeat protein At4g13965 [Arabidopsis lyrata subsp. lyrata]